MQFPEYFLTSYIIITGAHFSPYAWYYNERAYGIMAGVISVGVLLMSLLLPHQSSYYQAVYMVICLATLSIVLYGSYKKKVPINT